MTLDGTLRIPGVEVPPQSLRLDAPVWGIDPSTKRIAITSLDPRYGEDAAPRMRVTSLVVRQLDAGPRRAAALAFAVRDRCLALLDGEQMPSVVWIEQPFGHGKRRPHPELYYAVAATQIGVVMAVGDRVRVETTEPQTWKALALGRGGGNAGKGRILRWARSIGYNGQCDVCHAAVENCDAKTAAHDEADSAGIATAAGIVRAGEEEKIRFQRQP